MPHALRIDSAARITGYDPSRAQTTDGTPGPGWQFVLPEQYAAAQALAYPKWTGNSVVDDPPPPPTLAEIQASKTAEIVADCDRRLEQRWPVADRLAVTLGVPLEATPEIKADVGLHLKLRDVAVAAIAAAKDNAAVAAAAPKWPDDKDPAERVKLDAVAWDTANPVEAKP
jgi:hypothetical protein